MAVVAVMFVTMVAMVPVMVVPVMAMVAVPVAGRGRASDSERESSHDDQHNGEAFHCRFPETEVCLWGWLNCLPSTVRSVTAEKVLQAER